MKSRYDSYCGLYCGACEILLVNENGEIKSAAKKWNMNSKDIICFGCTSDRNAIYCVDCEFKRCCESKQIDFCFQCIDFPCINLIEFKNDKYSHHSIVMKNLELIKKKGLKEWLLNQGKRWKCIKCGTRFTWYDEKCKNCGEGLYNCKDEEKDL